MAKRILAIASQGGHWVELRRLLPAFEGLDVAFASTYPEYAEDVPGYRFYTFPDFSRFAKLRIFLLVLHLFRILLIERPHVIITTGSAPALACLGLGKLLIGAHTIWIDSIANSEELSSSGARAKHVADTWLTQWEHLATDKGPKYWGAVL